MYFVSRLPSLVSNSDNIAKKTNGRLYLGDIDYDSRLDIHGDFRLLTGKSVQIYSIFRLLHIKRGTYPFDPNFGLDLERFLFEFSIKEVEETIRDEVYNYLRLNEPRIHITSINVQSFADGKGFRVNVFVQIDRSLFKVYRDVR